MARWYRAMVGAVLAGSQAFIRRSFVTSRGPVLRLAAAECEDRERDADHRDDRADDGPGGGVAHRAAADDAETLQSPKQTEQRDYYSENADGDTHASTVGPQRPTVSAR